MKLSKRAGIFSAAAVAVSMTACVSQRPIPDHRHREVVVEPMSVVTAETEGAAFQFDRDLPPAMDDNQPG